MAKLAGKKAMFDQLWGSLELDISKARNQLGWQPRITIEEELDLP
jgi:nucleoside-diphosphate-sugar epimerase